VRDLLHRLIHAGDPDIRALGRDLWPFVAWSALAAYVEFWDRMDRRWIVAGPSPAKVVVPPHDYLQATRIMTLAGRRRVDSLCELLQMLDREFLDHVRFHYPELRGAEDPDVLFLAVLEVLGRDAGLAELRRMAGAPGLPDGWREWLERFFARVAQEGFASKPLVFAVRRYHRWRALTPEAPPAARANMLRELWTAYGLAPLQQRYPELRMRFFRQTVFAEADESLARDLDRLIEAQREERLATQDLLGRISRLQEQATEGTEEEFFLARMAYPYLEDTAPASLVRIQEGSLVHADLVVTLPDADGRPLRIRHAATPKEVGRLRRLFMEAELNLHFLPEHNYLVVLDDRDYVVGGLVYLEESAVEVRIERYVTAPHRRKKGVARLLVDEFCNRMAGRGKDVVRLPFMHPRYHESLGFVIDHANGGLLRHLGPLAGAAKPAANDPGAPGEARAAEAFAG